MKGIFLVKRRAKVEIERFWDLFLTRELQAVRSRAPRNYVQHHALAGGYRRGEPPFDLVVEVSVGADTPHLELFRGVGAWSEVAAAAVDRSLSIGMLVTEEVIKPGTPDSGGVTSFAPVCRAPGTSRHEFFRYWLEVHGPVASQIPQLSRYVQCHAVWPISWPNGHSVEGCAVTWFANTAAMRRSATTPEYAATRADESNFVAGVPLQVITTEQARIGGLG